MGKGNVRAMRWSDYNFDPYAISVIASEKMIATNPQMLKAFLEASYMGWRDALANMDEGLAIFKKRVPELDLPVAREAMPMVFDLLQSKRYEEHGIGWIDKTKMCRTVELVNENMKLPRNPACDEVYTSALLPVIKPKH
jgi:NitT/TauT family transport system substrate-binding protein